MENVLHLNCISHLNYRLATQHLRLHLIISLFLVICYTAKYVVLPFTNWPQWLSFLQIHLSLKIMLLVFYHFNLKLCILTDFILLVFVCYAFIPNITWADCLVDRFYNFLNCSCFPRYTLWFWNSQGIKNHTTIIVQVILLLKERYILLSNQRLGMWYKESMVSTHPFVKYHSVNCHQFHGEFMHSV